MTCRLFATPAKAFADVLAQKPLVLAIGEAHQTNETVDVRSAISRFTESMLPMLKHRASDLVVETWVAEGKCGEEEERAVEGIDETTERPETTEDEVTTLILHARDLAILPSILEVSCKDYHDLFDDKREIDSEKLLLLVTRLLEEKVEHLYQQNQRRGSKRMVVIYGGAVHNDVAPRADLAAFSYGPALVKLTKGRYVELDLYVPELIENDEDYAKEAWYPQFQKHVSSKETLLIETSTTSFVLVFPKRR